MKPYDYKQSKLFLPCWASIKLDGIRGIYTPNGIISRNKKPILGLNHIYESLQRAYGNNSVEGELLIPGLPFDESAGLIRSHNPTPNAHIYLFDIINVSMKFEDRQRYLSRNLPEELFIRKIPCRQITNAKDLTMYYNAVVQQGFEGIMIKSPGHYYQHRRSWDWMRWVPIKTVDLKVVGYIEGKGKYLGTLGALMVEGMFMGKEIKAKVGTGFTDAQRHALWEKKERLTVEICYRSITENGSLRFPSFKRVRYDK
jgi:DNA ligase-1